MFIAGIKGEHCEPSERPDGTSVYLGGTTRMASVSSYEITQNGSRTKQMKDCEDDFEYLYGNGKYQLNVSLTRCRQVILVAR